MGKRIRITILVVVLLLSLVCLIPNPLNTAKASDGGTKTYEPLIPIYRVIDWNQIKVYPHREEYDPDAPNGETIKGFQVYIFGVCVYDGRYTVEGAHTR